MKGQKPTLRVVNGWKSDRAGAWVNDEDTKRAYERSDDAYRVFRKMLEAGHPPDNWG